MKLALLPKRRILFLLLGFGLALLFVWSRIRVVELGYAVGSLREACEKLERENGLLKSKIAEKTATSELVQMAGRLGMKPPRSEQMIYLQEEHE